MGAKRWEELNFEPDISFQGREGGYGRNKKSLVFRVYVIDKLEFNV